MRPFSHWLLLAHLITAYGGMAVTDGLATTDGGSADGMNPDAGTTKSTDPACSPTTTEGDLCTAENTNCNPSPCTDECRFCNSLYCAGGKWQGQETFPMPEAYCATALCGTLVCGKGEFCVRTHSGPQPVPPNTGISVAGTKLPSGCFNCSCASTAAACTGMQTQCNADPTTQKPPVDCFAQ